MKRAKTSQLSFGDLQMQRRKVKSEFFKQINAVIDRLPLRRLIEPVYAKGISPTGRPCHDSMVLFRMELMRVWYGLSDGEIEEQVNDRLSFSRFAGLGMDDVVPDSTTLCRFRNALVRSGVYDSLLREVNRQLEARHVMVTSGVIVDASVTDSPRRPRGQKEYEVSRTVTRTMLRTLPTSGSSRSPATALTRKPVGSRKAASAISVTSGIRSSTRTDLP